MTTLSTDALYVQLRNRLLTYADPDGHTLEDASLGVGERLYRVRAPDNAVFPYGVMTFKQPQNPDGEGAIKLVMDLEILFFGRPRGLQASVEALGDRAVQALKDYRNGSSGLVFFENAYSQTLPPFPAPADLDIVQVRVMGRMHCYPLFLTRLST